MIAGDVKAITKAPGIGKKTAERLLIELKDKLSAEEFLERSVSGGGEWTENETDVQKEAVQALVALGYSSTDALRAVRKVTDVAPDDVEGLLKAALKNF